MAPVVGLTGCTSSSTSRTSMRGDDFTCCGGARSAARAAGGGPPGSVLFMSTGAGVRLSAGPPWAVFSFPRAGAGGSGWVFAESPLSVGSPGSVFAAGTSVTAGTGPATAGGGRICDGRFTCAFATSSSVSSRMRNTRPDAASVTWIELSSWMSTITFWLMVPCSPSFWRPALSADIQFSAPTLSVTLKPLASVAGMWTSNLAMRKTSPYFAVVRNSCLLRSRPCPKRKALGRSFSVCSSR